MYIMITKFINSNRNIYFDMTTSNKSPQQLIYP